MYECKLPHNWDCSYLDKWQSSRCQNATFGSKGTAMRKLTHSESEIIRSINGNVNTAVLRSVS